MFVVLAKHMTRPLSHSDLLLYYYGEADAEISAFIQDNISEHPEWSMYFQEIYQAMSDMDTLMVSPNSTTLSIILEESDSKLFHSIG
jgi:hypothetical protein